MDEGCAGTGAAETGLGQRRGTGIAGGRARGPLTEAERKAQRLETEARTLSNLLNTAAGDLWPPVVDEISVDKGYEAALGSALGHDLDASTNISAPAHW